MKRNRKLCGRFGYETGCTECRFASGEIYLAEKLISERELMQGHAGTGGVQQHSIGDLYPWCIQAEGDLRPVMWRAVNLVTGKRGNLFYEYFRAERQAKNFLIAGW